MFTNASEFYATAAQWLDRDDLTDQIPDFVFMAEVQIAQELELEGTLLTATGTLATGDTSIPLPADLFVPRVLTLLTPSAASIDIVHPAEFNRRRTDGSQEIPSVGRIKGANIVFAPAANGAYPWELEYLAGVQHIAAGGTQLLTISPQGLLFGTLLMSVPFIENDARATTWQAGYTYAMTGAKRQMRRLKLGAGQIRSRYNGATP